MEHVSSDTTAQASHGYIADGALTLTLPPTAGLNLGDDVRVLVHGGADISVAPSSAQTFDYDRSQLGWRPLATPPVQWSQLVMSGDGTKLVGMSGNSSLYRSSDSGATWSQVTGVGNQLEAITMSGDGSVLDVGGWGNGFWYSTDSGANWTQSGSGPRYPIAMAMSADGATVFEVDDSGNNQLNTSTNSGADWSSLGSAPGQYIVSLACSADCSSVYAVSEYGGVYVYQTSSGWTQLTTIGNGESSGRVASSADGTKLVITVSGGQIVYSHDAGTTWASATLTANSWYPAAISADGATMLVAASSEGDSGAVAISKDSGVTWTVVDATPRSWQAVAITSDGTRPFAVASGGDIYAPGNGSVLATYASELDFVYEGDGAFLITNDAGVAYGPY